MSLHVLRLDHNTLNCSPRNVAGMGRLRGMRVSSRGLSVDDGGVSPVDSSSASSANILASMLSSYVEALQLYTEDHDGELPPNASETPLISTLVRI